MDLIPSFSVDHSRLLPGVYISRTDVLNGSKITTYDIRMKKPNIEPCVDVAAMHTLEHIIATYLRNNEKWKDSIIYWGPMGCLTGFYLIIKDQQPCEVIGKLMIEAFEYAANFNEKVPGTDAVNCGNYLMHNIHYARYEAAKYAEILKTSPCYEYPKAERLDTEKGKFFDS